MARFKNRKERMKTFKIFVATTFMNFLIGTLCGIAGMKFVAELQFIFGALWYMFGYWYCKPQLDDI